MDAYLADRLSIADLMTGWLYRDTAEQKKLLELFHRNETIEITWFEGQFREFAERSKQMGASDLRTKYVIASPVVTFDGDRAVSETNAIILDENVRLGLGCEAHSRFYDRVEKRDGEWKIAHRSCIYDMGNFTFPRGVVEIDRDTVERHPREYAPLVYLLEKSGFPVHRVFPAKGSDQEKAIKDAARDWLSSPKRDAAIS